MSRYTTKDGMLFYDKDAALAYDKVLKNRDAGLEAIKEGDYEFAAECFTTAIEFIRNTYQNEMDCFIKRGETYYRTGQIDKAIADFEYVIDKELYATLQGRNWLGIIYNDQANYYDAIYQFTEAIAFAYENAQKIGSGGNADFLNSLFARAYCNRGYGYSCIGDQKNAIDDYKIAADYGNSHAVKNLNNFGINYTPTSRDLYKETLPVQTYAPQASYDDDDDTTTYNQPNYTAISDWDYPGCIGTNIGCLFSTLPGTIVLILTLIFYPNAGLIGMIIAFAAGALAWFIWYYIALGYEKSWHLLPQFLIVIYICWILGSGHLIPFISKDLRFNVNIYEILFPKTATTTEGVRFRSSPEVNDNNVMLTIPKNTKVKVTGDEQNGWIPVEYDDKNGWVRSEYLK